MEDNLRIQDSRMPFYSGSRSLISPIFSPSLLGSRPLPCQPLQAFEKIAASFSSVMAGDVCQV